jgi:NAD+ synthase (glutamine-hydrolysing)
VGDLIFSLCDVRIGVEICEDAWSHDRPARAFAAKEVDLILNPSASHFSFGKLAVRKQIILESSRFCNAATVFTNLNGCEAGRLIYDGGALIAACGKLVRQGKRFSYRPVEITSAQIDLDHIKLERARDTHAPMESASPKFRTIEAPFEWNFEPYTERENEPGDWEISPDLKEEEFTRAIGLALFDYMRKSKSRGFVVSLSGGIDSSSIALLVHYMLKSIERELGPGEPAGFFEPFEDGGAPLTREQLAKRMLTCVYQSSENSGEATRHAAKTLAESLGFRFFHLDIQPLVDRYVRLAETCVDRKLDWEQDDTALQNIQARVRGPSVWLLANLSGALLLSTGNRSEAAVGYATMDGDTCGGLSPLGGIDKHFLTRWIRWVERTGPTGLGSVPEVRWITRQKPTAELRPPDRAQQDEIDLMPYSLLDRIEKAFIRQRKSPVDILRSLVEPHWTRDQKRQTVEYIKRFLRLWRQNQWKRERYAPSFHLDDESLDPRSSCRYPILSGDFRAEFEQLDREIS